jgi:hypothetical protein
VFGAAFPRNKLTNVRPRAAKTAPWVARNAARDPTPGRPTKLAHHTPTPRGFQNSSTQADPRQCARPLASISWSWSWRRVLGLAILGSRSYLLGLGDHLWVAVLTSRSRLRPLESGGLGNRLLACGRDLLVLCSWPCSPGLGFALLASRSWRRGLHFAVFTS